MNDEHEVHGELMGPDDGVEYIDGSTALMALNKSEIDIQIATAKRYPRSIKQFKQNAMDLACLDEETAGSMFYVLPRGGKKIEGPSTRLAEVVGSSWGNLRYGSRVVSTDDKFVTAQGACFDLEKNIAITCEVKRRITGSNGKRYNDDMITVTSNAACSIALRNAIFKIVPFAVVKSIYEQARQTSVGDATSIVAQRSKMLDWYAKAGASQEHILAFLGRAGVDDITSDDLITMRGLVNTIKEGETTIEAVLGPIPDKSKKVTRSDVNRQIDDAAKSTGKAKEPRPEVISNADDAARQEHLELLQQDIEQCPTADAVSEIQEREFNSGRWTKLQLDTLKLWCDSQRGALRKKSGSKQGQFA